MGTNTTWINLQCFKECLELFWGVFKICVRIHFFVLFASFCVVSCATHDNMMFYFMSSSLSFEAIFFRSCCNFDKTTTSSAHITRHLVLGLYSNPRLVFFFQQQFLNGKKAQTGLVLLFWWMNDTNVQIHSTATLVTWQRGLNPSF